MWKTPLVFFSAISRREEFCCFRVGAELLDLKLQCQTHGAYVSRFLRFAKADLGVIQLLCPIHFLFKTLSDNQLNADFQRCGSFASYGSGVTHFIGSQASFPATKSIDIFSFIHM